VRFFQQHQKLLPLRNRFEGGPGVSLYLGPAGTDDATQIQYRNRRLFNGQVWFPLSTGWNGGQEFFLHDSIIAQVTCPTEEITYSLPVAYTDTTFWLQLRTFAGGLENPSIYAQQRITVDSDQEQADSIDGSAFVTAIQKRDAGGLRVRFEWIPAITGIQPTQFTLSRTAGPTSPSDVSVTASGLFLYYEIDMASLQDAGAYTFALKAVNGAITKTLSTISFTADASGPAAVTSLAAEAC
jgi:hypothetical protein